MRLRIALSAVSALALLGVTAPTVAGAALSEAGPALVLDSSRVLGGGTLVEADYTVTCATGQDATLSLTVGQVHSGRIAASDQAGTSFSCTGTAQTVTVQALPIVPGPSFGVTSPADEEQENGPAALSAALSMGDDAPAATADDEVTLVEGVPTGQPSVSATTVGGGFHVTLTVRCADGNAGDVTVRVLKIAKSTLVDGAGAAELTCTGSDQTVSMPVLMNLRSQPNSGGPASIEIAAPDTATHVETVEVAHS